MKQVNLVHWEPRRVSLQGFDNNKTKYYLSLKTDEVLDVTTVKKDNFEVTMEGSVVPIVEKIAYLPVKNEVRVYLNKDLLKPVSINPYTVRTTGLMNISGETVILSEQVYFTPENKCELYDISAVNIWYMKDGTILYRQPENGPCDLKVRVYNSSAEEKNVSLVIRAIGSDGERSRELRRTKITLAPEEEFIETFKDIEFFEGETVDVTIEK